MSRANSHISSVIKVREDMKKGVYVENLSEFEVHTVGDILQLLTQVTHLFGSTSFSLLYSHIFVLSSEHLMYASKSCHFALILGL